MKYVYVKGVNFENKGAELMMRTIIQNLNILGDYKVVLTANSASPFEKRCELGAYQYFSFSFGRFDLNRLTYFIPQRLINWLCNTYGIVLEPKLSVVLDASGYAYGDKWPIRGLQRTCSQLKRFSEKGKKYIFMPQMLGPFEKQDGRKLVQDNFKYADLIVAREETSYNGVKDIIGNEKNLVIGPDFTNLLKVENQVRDENSVIIIPNSNMISHRSGHENWKTKYVGILEDFIEAALDKGMKVTVINHEGKSDRVICDQLGHKYDGKINLIQNYNALQIKTAIAQASFVISSRFHGCVSALSQGVACIGTSWSHKYEELYKDYDVSPLLISSPDDITDYKNYFNSILEHKSSYEVSIVDNGNKIKEKSLETWNTIKSVINE
ncbi:TPA: polysaccharide pyruvyl transferase family protein [Vibrio vulnificus]